MNPICKCNSIVLVCINNAFLGAEFVLRKLEAVSIDFTEIINGNECYDIYVHLGK